MRNENNGSGARVARASAQRSRLGVTEDTRVVVTGYVLLVTESTSGATTWVRRPKGREIRPEPQLVIRTARRPTSQADSMARSARRSQSHSVPKHSLSG